MKISPDNVKQLRVRLQEQELQNSLLHQQLEEQVDPKQETQTTNNNQETEHKHDFDDHGYAKYILQNTDCQINQHITWILLYFINSYDVI